MLVFKGRKAVYKQILLSEIASLKVQKESDFEELIPRTKTTASLVQIVKRQIQSYALRGCLVQQSGDSSSSDIGHFRQASIWMFDPEGDSEAVSLRISVRIMGPQL